MVVAVICVFIVCELPDVALRLTRGERSGHVHHRRRYVLTKQVRAAPVVRFSPTSRYASPLPSPS